MFSITNEATSTSNNNSACRHQAIAWDPSSPVTLTIPSTVKNKSGEENKEDGRSSISLNVTLSSTGVGCNPNEASALLDLLDAREELFGNSNEKFNEINAEQLHALSQRYRTSILNCMEGWEEQLYTENSNSMSDDNNNENDSSSKNEVEKLELLKLMLSVTHLSEIFLLPPLINSIQQQRRKNYHENNVSGSLTSNTIRYLRYNHLSGNALLDDKELVELQDVNEMLSSDQPEYWGEDNDEADGGGGSGDENYSAYWCLVKRLISRGCLRDAWAVLSRHSSCRNASDQDGFAHLRALLLSAPVPGGRDDDRDANLGKNEEVVVQDKFLMGEDGDGGVLLGGIPPLGYEGWDSVGPGLAAAQSHWKEWSSFVNEAAREGGPGIQGGLLYRVPQLRWAVLDVLSGRADIGSHESWAEALCSELLYKHPSIQPDDIWVRTSTVMRDFKSSTTNSSSTANTPFETIVLDVMKKDAGRAVEALHSFGGGSGAALPATMTAFLCDLLSLSGRIPRLTPITASQQQQQHVDLRCELFLSASVAVESSFHSLNQDEVGVKTAARLLLLEGSARAKHTLYDLMCRRIPSSDTEAKALIQICETCPELTDAGTSLALARARFYQNDMRPGGAAFWMLRGVQADQKTVAADTTNNNNSSRIRGTACARLGVFCGNHALHLLKSLVLNSDANLVSKTLLSAKEILNAIREDDALPLTDGITKSSFSLLANVVDLAVALAEKRNKDAADNIVVCLAGQVDTKGVLHSLAHETLHLDLLKLAFLLLKQDERVTEERQMEKAIIDPDMILEDDHTPASHTAASVDFSSFDVSGIHTLLSAFKTLEATYGHDYFNAPAATIQNDSTATTATNQNEQDTNNLAITFSVAEMRLMLGRGLMRAFVSENAAQKEITAAAQIARETEEAALHAPPLLGGKEQHVDLLLGPPLCQF